MTGLIDGGIASLFGAVFGGLYPDGTLYPQQPFAYSYGGDSIDPPAPAGIPIKVQQDRVTKTMRDSDEYTIRDAALVVLTHGVPQAPVRFDQIENGTRWKILSTELDGAGSHWLIHATPAQSPVP